uniref:Uncharacterized protein n=1 Tax=Hordeum vulgare subsp. vulgare TaxID=112509 RepID=A0A8I6WKV9_HORVV
MNTTGSHQGPKKRIRKEAFRHRPWVRPAPEKSLHESGGGRCRSRSRRNAMATATTARRGSPSTTKHAGKVKRNTHHPAGSSAPPSAWAHVPPPHPCPATAGDNYYRGRRKY